MIRDHFLDRRKLKFPAFFTAVGWLAAGVLQRDRGLVADGPVRPILVVVSDPSLHLFGRIRKRQEPVHVQALTSEATIERLDEGVVGGLPGREKSSVTPFA